MNNSLKDIAGSYAKYNWISELKVVVFQVGIVLTSAASPSAIMDDFVFYHLLLTPLSSIMK